MITSDTATEYAQRLKVELDLTRGETTILGHLLAAGPHVAAPRDLWARKGSNSGEVLLHRLRQKLVARGWRVQTVFEDGTRADDGRTAMRGRGAAVGYGFSIDTFEALCSLAETLPATLDPSIGAGA